MCEIPKLKLDVANLLLSQYHHVILQDVVLKINVKKLAIAIGVMLGNVSGNHGTL
jgi:hypothetical protein